MGINEGKHTIVAEIPMESQQKVKFYTETANTVQGHNRLQYWVKIFKYIQWSKVAVDYNYSL